MIVKKNYYSKLQQTFENKSSKHKRNSKNKFNIKNGKKASLHIFFYKKFLQREKNHLFLPLIC